MHLMADKVSHLTAARYFAARGAEWLVFDPTETSIPEIQAIRDWVEGPSCAISLALGMESMDDDVLRQLAPEGIVLGVFAKPDGLPEGIPRFKEWRIDESDSGEIIRTRCAGWPDVLGHILRMEHLSGEQVLDLWPALPHDLPLWLALTPPQVHPLEDRLNEVSGICLASPPEEAVGLAAFDDLDEVIDRLEG